MCMSVCPRVCVYHFQTPNSPVMESKITEIAEVSVTEFRILLCKRVNDIQRNQTVAQTKEIQDLDRIISKVNFKQ